MSQNHRIIWVGRDLQRSSSPTPAAVSMDIFNYIRLLRAPSSLTLKVARDGQPFPVFQHPHYKNFLPHTQVYIIPCPVTTGPAKKPVSIFLISPLLLKCCNKVSPEPYALEVNSSTEYSGQQLKLLRHLFPGGPREVSKSTDI